MKENRQKLRSHRIITENPVQYERSGAEKKRKKRNFCLAPPFLWQSGPPSKTAKCATLFWTKLLWKSGGKQSAGAAKGPGISQPGSVTHQIGNVFSRRMASSVPSLLPKAVRRKNPSPFFPKPQPGVPTTWACSSNRSKNSQELRFPGHLSQR